MPRAPLIRACDVLAALTLLTRLPVPPARGRGAASSWAFPIAGLAAGGAAGLVAWATLGLGPGLAAVLALSVQVMLTGALHEDGLADCADGFWGGRDRRHRLAIMKDSQVGSFGVLALVLSMIARWSALTGLLAAGASLGPLVAAGVLSRAAMPAVMAALAPAAPGGLAHSLGRPAGATVVLGVALAISVAWVATGFVATIAATCAVVAAAAAVAGLARTKIGGMTGDVLGAVQQASEIAALAAFVAVIA